MRTSVRLATAVMVFGLFFAQTKSPDHTPDLVIWSFATILLLAALILGWRKEPKVLATAVGWVIAILVELAYCIGVTVYLLMHLHSLR